MSTVVYVCPERDIECGQRQDKWCATCPKYRAAEQVRQAPREAVAADRRARTEPVTSTAAKIEGLPPETRMDAGSQGDVSNRRVQQPAQSIDTPERMSIDEAREYLVNFMEQHFTDKTFHRYIRGDRVDRSRLAGDFAWQMARALRIVDGRTAGTAGDAVREADYFYTFTKPAGWINLQNPGQSWQEWTREQGAPTTKGWKVFGIAAAPSPQSPAGGKGGGA